MTMSWDHDMSAGIPRVDDDHREILSLIQLLCSPANDAVPSEERALEILAGVERYLQHDIEVEERLMMTSGYTASLQHAADHSRLTAHVTALRLSVELGSIHPRTLAESARGLADEVTEHIDTFDRYLSRFLRGRELS